MVALKLLLAAALLGSLIWTLIDPGYEPITAVIIAAGCLLAIRHLKTALIFKPITPQSILQISE